MNEKQLYKKAIEGKEEQRRVGYWKHLRNKFVAWKNSDHEALMFFLWIVGVIGLPILSIGIPLFATAITKNLWCLVGCFSIIPALLLSDYLCYRDSPDIEPSITNEQKKEEK